MGKLYIIAAQHGDEVFGLKIVGHMQRQKNDNCIFRVGHPEAVAKGVRCLQTDLNRSYGDGEHSVERELASVIEQEIRSIKPDLIIDLHTSVSNVDKVAILAEASDQMIALAQFLGMTEVVILPKHLLKGSLIGTFGSNSIALEFGRGRRSDKLAKEAAAKIADLKDYRFDARYKVSIPVYRVTDTIDKTFKDLEGIQNLQFNEQLAGYPFLAGPNTYKHMGGFLAQKLN